MRSAEPWVVRPAVAGDLSEIVAIEEECFKRPWSPAIYAEEFNRSGTWLDVAQAPGGEAPGGEAPGGGLLGFLCAWRVGDACHLLRIACRQRIRGLGVGGALVERLILRASAAECARIELEVASQNVGALGLYRRLGFVEVGRRPRYYRSPVDDAILMDRPLP